MTKFLLSLLLTVVVTDSLLAEVIIRDRDIPNRPGMVATYSVIADPIEGIEVDLGESGEGRMWDFTGFDFGEITSDTLLDPEEAPDRERFPRANRVITSETNELGLNIGGGLQYEILADSGLYMLGASGGFGGGFGFDSVLVFPNPLLLLPFPAEMGEDWEIAVNYEFGFPAPDTLLGGAVDSVIIHLAIGGFSEIDGDGVVAWSGGELPAIRQHMRAGGTISVKAVTWIFNRRIVVDLPYGYEMEATHTYRWIAPAMGEIARVTSLLGEVEENFDRASEVRVRRVIPALDFPAPPIAFGIVHVGNSGASQLVISNSGEGLGSITRVEFSDGLESEIEILSDLPLTILPDSSARLRLLWSPTAEKSLWPGTAEIYHNDPALHNPLVVSLQGATPEFQAVTPEKSLPLHFEVVALSPNPFNSTAELTFRLPERGRVDISLFDPIGRIVGFYPTGELGAGEHRHLIQSNNLTAGTYLLQVRYGDSIVSSRLTLLK